MTPEKRAEVVRIAVRSVQAAHAWASLDVRAATVLQTAAFDPCVDAMLARFEASQPRRAVRQVAAILRLRARREKVTTAG